MGYKNVKDHNMTKVSICMELEFKVTYIVYQAEKKNRWDTHKLKRKQQLTGRQMDSETEW